MNRPNAALTRFAPSPSGNLHVGNVRTALLNFLFARKNKGQFMLRIDDTNGTGNEVDACIGKIKEDLEWLGLEWDRVERQSDRKGIHEEAFRKLGDRAYAANGISRFRLDRDGNRYVHWHDNMLGSMRVDVDSQSDPSLKRSDGSFLYNMASVADDIDMGITHVIRGNDHVTNSAVQMQMFNALGEVPPEFGHHSLMIGPNGEKMSKREKSDLTVAMLREAGVQSMAVLSMIAKSGRSGTIELACGMDDLINGFDLNEFGKSSIMFNMDLARGMSSKCMRNMNFDSAKDMLSKAGIPDDKAEKFWNVFHSRVDRDNLNDWWIICRDGVDPLNSKVANADREFVRTAMEYLPPKPFNDNTWSDWTNKVKDATGRKGKDLYMPLRHALTGKDDGPEMASLMPMLS